jgi:hypothetical protein
LVASFYHTQGGAEYFPLFYIDPQTQVSLTGNHFPTVCSSWTHPANRRLEGMTRRISLAGADLQKKFHLWIFYTDYGFNPG